jgi:hypothetical protein
MSSLQRTALQICSCLLLFLQTQARATTTYDFESFVDSDILTNQLPGAAFANTIILTAGISLNEFEFPPHSGVNVASDNGAPISISFTGLALNFSGYFTYATQLTLTAFDAGSNQVGQAVSLFNSNLALSGDVGSSPNEFLQVASVGGISSLTITGDPAGGSFVMDDVSYQSSTTTPEPETGLLLLSSMALLAMDKKLTFRL